MTLISFTVFLSLVLAFQVSSQSTTFQVPPAQEANARLLFNQMFSDEKVSLISGLSSFQDFTSYYIIKGTTDADFEIFLQFLQDFFASKTSIEEQASSSSSSSEESPLVSVDESSLVSIDESPSVVSIDESLSSSSSSAYYTDEPSMFFADFATIFYAFMNNGGQYGQIDYATFSAFRSSLGWVEDESYKESLFKAIVFSDCSASLESLMGGEAFNYFTTQNIKLMYTIPGGETWTEADFWNLYVNNQCFDQSSRK